MRKGYGKTGVSFSYTFAEFEKDCDAGVLQNRRAIGQSGLDVNGTIDMRLEPEHKRKALYDHFDCVQLTDLGKVFYG